MISSAQLNEILNHVAAEARRVFGDALESVILFGSYARGDQDEDSDIDVMILADIAPEDVNRYSFALIDRIYEFEIENDCLVSPCVVPKRLFDRYRDALPLYQNVMREGMTVGV